MAFGTSVPAGQPTATVDVVSLEQIRSALDVDEAMALIEEGFKAYSQGRTLVPMCGFVDFTRKPVGDCHVKAGFIEGDNVFVVKVSTWFGDNRDIGLPSSDGFMVLISSHTGEPVVFLQDRGYLTHCRTAIAGLIAARHVAPPAVGTVGIVGAGTQARLHLELLLRHYGPRPVMVWARDPVKAEAFAREMSTNGTHVQVARTLQPLCMQSNLIVTSTASTGALVMGDWIRPGTHITAIGADARGKQELDPRLIARADVRVVDSISQCVELGDTAHAINAGLIDAGQLVELGAVIADPSKGRTRTDQITVADLTGIAVQDVQIAKHVWSRIRKSPSVMQ